jgi:hypothetical protein
MEVEITYHCQEFVALFTLRDRKQIIFSFKIYILKDWNPIHYTIGENDTIYNGIDQIGNLTKFTSTNDNGYCSQSFLTSECEAAITTISEASQCYKTPCINILLYGSKLIDCFPIYDTSRPKEEQCDCGAFRYNNRIFALKESIEEETIYRYTFILIDKKINMKNIKIKGKLVLLYNLDSIGSNISALKANNEKAFKERFLSFDVSIKDNKVDHVLDGLV